ncbi:hypothetical protein Patl1_23895 [Pistacia atlantica]|uniref:Uncharacterized protein n=1 Tax=Pistacia atlantica TaxID=434234 RepID=A0ACC0ZZQ0_9ROSI|nr:hypothetical protein Patl1_23895 [Pistacia atlantica]
MPRAIFLLQLGRRPFSPPPVQLLCRLRAACDLLQLQPSSANQPASSVCLHQFSSRSPQFAISFSFSLQV